MTFETEEELNIFIKENMKLSPDLARGRKEAKEMNALVFGVNFLDELIKIDNLESSAKQQVRKKFAQPIMSYYAQLTSNIENCFAATGGIIDFNGNEHLMERYANLTKRLKCGKSLNKWVQDNFVDIHKIDPNGVIMVSNNGISSFPVYKSSSDIRAVKTSGRKVEAIMFEPYEFKNGDATELRIRVLDDETDYILKQGEENYIIIEDETFEHSYGQCPCICVGDTDYIGTQVKKNPLSVVTELSREFLRDKSIKTIHKALRGVALHWRKTAFCIECSGTGKVDVSNDDGEYRKGTCGTCSGKGSLGGDRDDVADIIEIKAPETSEDPDINQPAGYIEPSTETWNQYIKEQELNMQQAYKVIWGTLSGFESKTTKTATEITFDKQPIENTLNKYSNNFEDLESFIGTMLLRKDTNNKEVVVSKGYGRNFILQTENEILDRYYKGKEKGANSVILDSIMKEYLNSKYKNNVETRALNLLKLSVEPYPHYSIKEVFEYISPLKSQHKALFIDFWNSNDFTSKSVASDILKKFTTFVEGQIIVPVTETEN